MKQTIKQILIKEIYDGYSENQDGEILGMSGKLLINPAFQREFIYDDSRKRAVLDTILNECSLGILTFFKDGENDFYTCGDGLQRLRSILDYLENKFTIDRVSPNMFFHNLLQEDQDKILNYNLIVCEVEATPLEQLEWFKRINYAGLELKSQEMLNAIYVGSWLTSAKQYFSKANCPGYINGQKYISGTLNRQDFLETALEWVSGDKPEIYMAAHQHDQDASELFNKFKNITDWISKTFNGFYIKEMKGLDWGKLYRDYGDLIYDPATLKTDIMDLLMDDEVTKKSGIIDYVLSGKSAEHSKSLNLRAFTPKQKIEALVKQNNKCAGCGCEITIDTSAGDHIIPWSKGGKTIDSNLQMLCTKCNLSKSNK